MPGLIGVAGRGGGRVVVRGAACTFPDYGAGRIVIDGAFSPGFHAWGELALALGWLAVLGFAVAWVLHRLLSRLSLTS
jgi:hypothetical protein